VDRASWYGDGLPGTEAQFRAILQIDCQQAFNDQEQFV